MGRSIFAVAFSVFAAGCSLTYRVEGVPTQHIIMVDSNGRLMDPTGSVECHPQDIKKNNVAFSEAHPGLVVPPAKRSWQPCNGKFNGFTMRALPEREVRGYLNDMFAAMDDYFERRPDAKGKVVVIIHGGLDTNHANLERARDIAQHILDDGQYPIFINWQSNLFRSLAAHLFTVRHGDYVGAKSAILSPLHLAADLGTGVAHAPLIWVDQVENDIDRVRRRFTNHRTRADNSYCALWQEHLDCPTPSPNCRAIDISKGPFQQTIPEGTQATFRFAATGFIPLKLYGAALQHTWPFWTWLPARYILSPIVYGLGGPAWEEMERHATLGFHGLTEASTTPGYRGENETGGIARFLKALQEKIGCPSPPDPKQYPPCDAGWELTLIGHSMGAIVENHILRDFDDIPFRHIVYMASAASVRDYEDSVFPYLELHPKTEVHHLLLHDFSEIRDQYGVVGPLELPPSGSLLVWIDNFFTRPPTLRDRTAGRFDNLMLFLGDTPPEFRDRIQVKTFGVGRVLAMTDPQHHGSFNEFDGNPHACVGIEDLAKLDKAVQPCTEGMNYQPCIAWTNGNDAPRKRQCVYADRFWHSSFWKPEREERPTVRPACLLNNN